jgi:hypothetical protein
MNEQTIEKLCDCVIAWGLGLRLSEEKLSKVFALYENMQTEYTTCKRWKAGFGQFIVQEENVKESVCLNKYQST